MADVPRDDGLSLEQFLMLMCDGAADELTQERLLDCTSRLSLPAELVEAHARFAKDDYARNLLCRTQRFELLVLCWRPGQRSTIHDHGGSLNAIKVQRGELTSRLYEPASGRPPRASGPVRQVGEYTARPGELAGVGSQGIHQLANTGSADLVTLHVYAPPLMHLTVYSLESAATQMRPLRYTLSDDLA